MKDALLAESDFSLSLLQKAAELASPPASNWTFGRLEHDWRLRLPTDWAVIHPDELLLGAVRREHQAYQQTQLPLPPPPPPPPITCSAPPSAAAAPDHPSASPARPPPVQAQEHRKLDSNPTNDDGHHSEPALAEQPTKQSETPALESEAEEEDGAPLGIEQEEQEMEQDVPRRQAVYGDGGQLTPPILPLTPPTLPQILAPADFPPLTPPPAADVLPSSETQPSLQREEKRKRGERRKDGDDEMSGEPASGRSKQLHRPPLRIRLKRQLACPPPCFAEGEELTTTEGRDEGGEEEVGGGKWMHSNRGGGEEAFTALFGASRAAGKLQPSYADIVAGPIGEHSADQTLPGEQQGSR